MLTTATPASWRMVGLGLKVVSIAAQTEARRLAELLGLAGPKSRIIMDNPALEIGSNPFARRR